MQKHFIFSFIFFMTFNFLVSFSLNENSSEGSNVHRFPSATGFSGHGGSNQTQDRYLDTTILGLQEAVDSEEGFNDKIYFWTLKSGEDIHSQGSQIFMGKKIYKSLLNFKSAVEKANVAIKDSKIGLGHFHSLSRHLTAEGSKEFGLELRPIEVDAVSEDGSSLKVFEKAYSEIEDFETLHGFLKDYSQKILDHKYLLSNEKIRILDQLFSQLSEGPAKQYLMNQLLAFTLDQTVSLESADVEKLAIVSEVVKGQKINLDSPDIAVNPICDFLNQEAKELASSCRWSNQIEVSEFIEKLNLVQDTYELDLEGLKCIFSPGEKDIAKTEKEKLKFWQGFAQAAQELVDQYDKNDLKPLSASLSVLSESSNRYLNFAKGYKEAYNSEGEKVFYKEASPNGRDRGFQFAHTKRRLVPSDDSKEANTDIVQNDDEEDNDSIVFSSNFKDALLKADQCNPRKLASAIRDIKRGVNKESGSMGDFDVNEVYKLSGRGTEGDSVDLKVAITYQSAESECKNKDLKKIMQGLLDSYGSDKVFKSLQTGATGRKKLTSDARCHYEMVLNGSIQAFRENTLETANVSRISDGAR